MSVSELSWAVSSFDLANMASALPAGLLAERFGRRGCLLAVGCLLVSSFSALYAPGWYAVIVGRSLAGVCKSVAYVTVPGYLAEVVPAEARGRVTVALVAFDSLGMLVSMVAGPRISYNLMNGLSLVAAVVFWVAVAMVPETPYYLLAKGRQDEARSAMHWYRPYASHSVVDSMNRLEQSVQEDMREPGTYHELFEDDGNRVALMLVAGACFAQRVGGISCVVAYSTTTLPADGPVRPENVAAVFAAVRLAFTLAAAPLIDGFGRRPLSVGSHGCLAAVTATYAGYLYAAANTHLGGHWNWTPSVCVVLFTVAYSMGAGIVPGALVGEMFPANVKSQAVSVVAIVSSLGAFLTNKMYLLVSLATGAYVMFIIFTVVNITWAICAYLFLFETKAMSLSAIQDTLDDYNSSSESSAQNA